MQWKWTFTVPKILGAEDVYNGPKGKPETTGLRNPSLVFDWCGGFIVLSKRVDYCHTAVTLRGRLFALQTARPQIEPAIQTWEYCEIAQRPQWVPPLLIIMWILWSRDHLFTRPQCWPDKTFIISSVTETASCRYCCREYIYITKLIKCRLRKNRTKATVTISDHIALAVPNL